jgi:hypothetical protein
MKSVFENLAKIEVWEQIMYRPALTGRVAQVVEHLPTSASPSCLSDLGFILVL